MRIPKQEEGKKLDLSAKRKFLTREDAMNTFEKSRQKLLDINDWNKVAGSNSAVFMLCDQFGQQTKRRPILGDLVMIDVPGIGRMKGDRYDWVRIVVLDDEFSDRSIQLTLQPASSPNTDGAQTAHFFKASSSSSFVIQLVGLEVRINYYGRNQQVNTASGNFLDNIRNVLIGLAAKLGLSDPQWKKLVSGFLAD